MHRTFRFPISLALILGTTLLFSDSLRAEIKEAPTMKEALEGADENTLVLFDLDNTVMMPPQTLGSEEWFDYLVDKREKTYVAEGLKDAKTKAVNESISDWNDFHLKPRVIMIPVEMETPSLIAGVQAIGAKTMALTARGDSLLESTREQLKSIGIDLNVKAPYSKKITLTKKEGTATYDKGLLLVGSFSKGEALVQFLKKSNLKPKKIIFIDNKLYHVERVEKALAGSNIPYFGRRHGFADSKIASMDKSIVDLQHKYFFGEPLSNEDAKKLISK